MTEIHVLKEIDPVGTSVLEMVEYVRDKTEKGEIGQVLIVTLDRAGAPDWWHSKLYNISTMIGALERAKHALLKLTED